MGEGLADGGTEEGGRDDGGAGRCAGGGYGTGSGAPAITLVVGGGGDIWAGDDVVGISGIPISEVGEAGDGRGEACGPGGVISMVSSVALRPPLYWPAVGAPG